MAYSNQELVAHLVACGVLKTPRLVQAFRQVDRRWFVPADLLSYAYDDAPLPIGFGQTISQPWTVAFMLELLQPRLGQKILDVGAGSGYTTALLAEVVGAKGAVLGVEIIPELARRIGGRLRDHHFANVTILAGAATKIIGRRRFDRILVSAAAAAYIPSQFTAGLGRGGRLVIPVDNAIHLIAKTSTDRLAERVFPGFAFVPLSS